MTICFTMSVCIVRMYKPSKFVWNLFRFPLSQIDTLYSILSVSLFLNIFFYFTLSVRLVLSYVTYSYRLHSATQVGLNAWRNTNTWSRNFSLIFNDMACESWVWLYTVDTLLEKWKLATEKTHTHTQRKYTLHNVTFYQKIGTCYLHTFLV